MSGTGNMAEERDGAMKYPKTPHLPFSPGVQSDDTVLSSVLSSRIHFLGKEAVLTEKLDGGNCSLYRGKVYARSTSAEATHPSFGPIKQLAAEISYAIPSTIQLFGENMFGIHSLEYSGLESFYYLFAALDQGSHYWLPWDHVTELANEVSIPTVPLLTRGTFDSMDQVEKEISAGMRAHSKVGSCHPEGFVIRTVDGFTGDLFDRHVAKYVRQGHIQTEDSWRRTWKAAKLAT